MADNEAVHDGGPIAGGSFSQLLFAAEEEVGLDTDGFYNYTSSFSPQNPPKMLCFEDYRNKCEIATTAQKSGVTCSSDSSSPSSINNKKNKNSDTNAKKRNGRGNESVQSLGAGDRAPAVQSPMNCKKAKSENSTVTGNGKVKREKLGNRIAALQQLVSPYGKTDTASVLHEAMGYIRFLHEQVQVLCSPYLQQQRQQQQQSLPSSLHLLHHQGGGENGEEEESRKDLRSRGLRLVPLECTAHVANNNNGADFWSPAAMGNNFSPKH